MIGQPGGVCLFLTCDSTRTKYYGDEFRQMEFTKGLKNVTIKAVKQSGLALCDRHVQEIIVARHSGEAVCLTPEGWIYIDNWNWLLYG